MSSERAGSTGAPQDSGAIRRVVVLGAGGVGGLLAGLLARAGAEVLCVARPESAAVLASRGLSVRSTRFGDFTVRVQAAERLETAVDLCLVTVKATQLEAALDRVPPDVLGDALVLPLLNGVEHLAQLRARYPAAAVVAATIRVESTRSAPGQVLHESPFAAVALAADGPHGAQVRAAAQLLEHAGLDVEVGGDDKAVLWAKLGFLAPLALLTTHAQAPAGVVREQHPNELATLAAEVAAVARAEGAPGDGAAVLALFAQIPASMQSSMQRDAAAGRPLELEAIGGAVLRAAARHEVPVPLTTRLIADLRARHQAPEGAP